MENAAARVYEDPDIVEEVGKDKQKQTTTSVVNEIRDNESQGTRTRRKLFCGCCSNQSEVGTSDSAVSSAEYHGGSQFNEIQVSRSFSQETRLFLNSPVYYIFVIVVTFLIAIVLLVELLMETELFHTSESTRAINGGSQPDAVINVSTTLHWFSFALLAVFFIEIILRVAVWNLALVKDYISIFDCIVVLIAFLSDLIVTLVAGPDSAIDGISLIIILRLIRIHTLVKVKVEGVKKKRDARLNEVEDELHTANCTISGLRRQIKEKDYEIKQLQTYLGGQISTDDPQLLEVIKASMRDQDTKGATADTELQMAIALSKQTFNQEGNGGVINKAFMHPKSEDKDLTVLVHERPDRLNSQESDIEPVAKATSYMDEYFTKPVENGPNDKLSSDPSTGAIPKKKNLTLLRTNSNRSNNNSNELQTYEASLKVLQTDEPNKVPITVCIDPTILQCDWTTPDEKDSNNWLPESPTRESSEEPRSTFSSPASDVGSSDECNADSIQSFSYQPVKSQTDALKSLAKKSGSSVSSESGYLSEDFSGKKKLALPVVNANMSDVERETSAV